ncbi:type II CAAX endopeptidase family protein [Clostridium sp.]|uniref:CPBP family intramembrane glutamic endopeptidase n=1 Tax=Clostridium sp. TaxID=1506 RepID=UPI00283B2095|nr:type II CAAX endopeptidase family protein [Clostridium sp.]MDR3597894.1 type II CAAX endopeptidase family protein [Clostridium sp.]
MKIFKNNNNVVRSGWKIASLYFTFSITTIIFSGIFGLIYSVIFYNKNHELSLSESDSLREQFSGMSHFPGICLYLIQCITLIFLVVLFWKLWDKGKIRDIGLTNIKSSWIQLCTGLFIGAISFTTVAIILISTKSVELVNNFSKPNFSGSLIIQLIIFIFVGINEELFSRGYCMTVLKQTKMSWAPIVVSSIIFALMHSLNSGISLFAYINLFLFGITMGYIFIKTKNIWMCIGYHITWNYFQGDVFGFLVSGNATDSIYTVRTISPNIINGGSFGPEGGIVVTILLLLTIFLVYKFLPYSEA